MTVGKLLEHCAALLSTAEPEPSCRLPHSWRDLQKAVLREIEKKRGAPARPFGPTTKKEGER